jgi:methionine-rich copper-binding protein CopC
MIRIPKFAALAAAPLAIVLLVGFGAIDAEAHARYERSDPPAGTTVEASPAVVRAWFTQELMLRSGLAVTNEAGTQVDLGDGQVDPDDLDRKSMIVTLPPLPTGSYWVYYLAASAEDGHDEAGSFTFGVGGSPPAASGTPSPAPADLGVGPGRSCNGGS